MPFTFDGPNKLIILDNDQLSIQEMYSRWIDWLATPHNSKYLIAMRSVGGDSISDIKRLGLTFFMTNGWRIRPMESDQRLIVEGNLYTDPAGFSPFVSTLGDFNVMIESTVSSLVDTVVVSSSGASSDMISDINAIKSKTDQISFVSGKINAEVDVVSIAAQVRTDLTPELTHISTLQNGQGLDSSQATMLLEIYRIYGLDPNRPLIVTQNARNVAGISQVIVASDTQTTIARV